MKKTKIVHKRRKSEIVFSTDQKFYNLQYTKPVNPSHQNLQDQIQEQHDIAILRLLHPKAGY